MTMTVASQSMRVEHALERLDRWIANLEGNAAQETDPHARRRMTARASDLSDVRAILRGDEDAYILALRRDRLAHTGS